MRRIAFGLAMAALLAVPAAGQPADSTHGAFSILEENDLFFNTDRHYTNGTALAYTTPALDADDWAVSAADVLPVFQDHGRNYEVRATYELGQDMFTPDNTTLANPDPKDRPYAGFLFAAVGVLSKTDNRMDQLQLQLGVVGPASLAEDAQKFVHTILGDALPKGWSHQLRDEPGLELTYDRTYRTPKVHLPADLALDFAPHMGVAIGNVYDYVNAGAMARFGFNLPDDYGPMRLDPSLPGANFFEPKHDFSVYAFAGVDGRVVGRNLFLQGNSFQSGPRVDANLLVGDFLIGAAIETRWFRIAFTHDFRSKEFKTQTSTDQFGAVSLSFAL